MGKIKDAINNVDEIYEFINAKNAISKKRIEMKKKADIDCDKYHEKQDIEAMKRAKISKHPLGIGFAQKDNKK